MQLALTDHPAPLPLCISAVRVRGCAAEHEPLDPEYSILKQRLARRIRHDGLTDDDLASMDLVDITKVALLPGMISLTEHL